MFFTRRNYCHSTLRAGHYARAVRLSHDARAIRQCCDVRRLARARRMAGLAALRISGRVGRRRTLWRWILARRSRTGIAIAIRISFSIMRRRRQIGGLFLRRLACFGFVYCLL